jgi:lysophospholipase L1-like esterase
VTRLGIKIIRPIAALFALLCLAAVSTTSPTTAPATREGDSADTPRTAKILIVLAGDSTVTYNAGWGTGFVHHLHGDIQCINLSHGGRSSKSFINEGRWKQVLNLKPDYVLIQFGHNDQKLDDPARGTDPQTTYRQFMSQMVDQAIAAGIKPVLVTSVSRRQWGPDGKIHSTLTPYANVVIQIAGEKHVPLIDLHARSIELYERLGKPAIDALSPLKPSTQPTNNPGAGPKMILDNTHFNAAGSEVIGKLVADELAKAVPELAPYIRD